MMILDKFLKDSLKELSEMLSHTLNTLEEKQLQQWMLYTLLKDKEELSMVLAVDNSFKFYVLIFNLNIFHSFPSSFSFF